MTRPGRAEFDADRESRGSDAAVRTIRVAGAASGLLAVAAAGVSGYLVFASLSGANLPPGCGEGSGCASVLASKWSKVAGVPVGVPAMIVHLALAVLAAACVRVGPDRAASLSPWLGLVGSVAIASAGWFVFLQVAVLEAICPWCMADHALGVSAGVLGLFVVVKRGGRALPLAGGVAAAVLLVGVVAGMQAYSTPAVVTLEDMPTDRDFDRTEGGERWVGMLDGELRLNVAEEPGVGPIDAPVVAMMFDYACPHCRYSHELLKARLAADPDAFRLVLLPVPLNRQCNPHAPARPGPLFDESCEVARLALAVWRAAPGRFAAFDQWLYDAATPRTAAEARAEAERLAGADALAMAIESPWVRRTLDRNVRAYEQSGAGRVPVLLRPGFSPVVGRIDGNRQLESILTAAPEPGEPTVGGSE
ncbi:MAG: vitamin K epoxide reductase family protein [Phycisphaeraceae bacterium]